MIEEIKSCSDMMKKHFNKEYYWNINCHITGKVRGSVHRDCNINVKLNRKISAVFHNLIIYDSYYLIIILYKN